MEFEKVEGDDQKAKGAAPAPDVEEKDLQDVEEPVVEKTPAKVSTDTQVRYTGGPIPRK